jgi:alkyl hydroperoxide reductase subunit F
MNHIHDLIICGAGPAGITAAVYAARKQMDFVIVSRDIGGQAAWSNSIENYTGYQFITGYDLITKFREHIESFGVKVNEGEQVTGIMHESGLFIVESDRQVYQGRTAIIATGKRPKPLNVPGEAEFRGKGLAYCATCDAPLFRGREVAVIGGGNSALDAAIQLMRLCPKVSVINSASVLTGDEVMRRTVENAPNVEVINEAHITGIEGGRFVEAITIERRGSVSRIPTGGVFVEIGLIPNADFVKILEKNELDEIVVDCYNHTAIPGLFAAGDVTNVPEKQVIVACGEGAKAALGAYRYVQTHEFAMV